MDPTFFPVVQLYNLNPTGSVIIKYNKGGGAQSVTLTFDTVDQFAGLELDRSKYPTSTQVHATVTDVQLNQDPTDEDSWTFATNDTTQAVTNPLGLQTVYQLFDENGIQAKGSADNDITVDQAGGGTDLNRGATLPNLQFEDNGILILDANAQSAASDIVNLQDNDDQDLIAGATSADAETAGLTSALGDGYFGPNSQPVTLVERFAANGIFANYDESDIANIITTDVATNRGQSASIDYNETPQSIVLGFEYATLDIQPVDDEWNSGEEIPFILVDADANKNSRIDEDLDIFSSDVDLIPALATGNPFTLSDADTNRVGFFNTSSGAPFTIGDTLTSTAIVNATMDVEEFSFRGQITITNPANSTWVNMDGDGIVIDYRDATFEDLSVTAIDTRTSTLGEAGHQFHAFNYYNYD